MTPLPSAVHAGPVRRRYENSIKIEKTADMQRGDKVALGTAVPLIAIVIVVAIVLLLYVKPCGVNQTWDSEVKACRPKCARGQTFDKTTRQCVCPDAVAPVFDPASQQCVGVCDAGTAWNAKTRSCDRTPQQCYPPPSVNPSTGVIVNGGHFANGKGGCSGGTMEQLDQLCKSAECSSPQYCRPGDRWDGVAAGGQDCYKTEVCGLTPCDAAYCTNDTVRANVGPVMKVADNNGHCVNPSQAAVGAMCTAAAATNAWHAPNCYDTTPLDTLQVAVTSASNDAGKGIVGTVQHQLVNGPVDLNATGALVYTYTVSAPSALRVNNKWLRVSSADAVLASGTVQVTGVCTPADAASVCFAFNIDSAEIQHLPPASYVLRLTGYPSWDVTLPLYVTGQPEGFVLSGSSIQPNALTKLDVKFSKEDAMIVADNTLMLKSKLANLPADMLVPDPTVAPLTYTASNDALVADCQSGVCKTNETITRKFVVLAWSPLKLDKYALAGICPSGESVIKYYLARSHTETRDGKTVVVDDTLIGPTVAQLQPTSSDVSTGILSFVDLVDVNRTYTYKLGAYLADSMESTVEYWNATCYGTLQQMAVSVSRYTAAACHNIKYGVAGALPPHMTVTSAGTCEYNNTQPAKDFYCLYEFGGNGLDPAHLALSSPNGNSCYPLVQAYPAPKLTNTWDAPFATTASFDSCITGESQDLTVVCPDTVQLATVADKLDQKALQDRLQNVYNEFDTFNYNTSFSRAGLTADLFAQYAKCPPASDAKYGNAPEYALCKGDATCTATVLKKHCDTDDELCKTLVKNANCGYNTCGLWEHAGGQEYKINRSLFFDATQADASTKCCSGNGVYSKGKCACNAKVFGVQCQKDPCEEQFREHRAKGGFDCTPLGSPTPTGTCVPDSTGAVKCVCNADHFTVAQPPALDIYKDCKWYKKEYMNNPASPSGSQQFNPFHDNPQKMACEAAQRADPNTTLCNGIQCNPMRPDSNGVLQRDSDCIVDPYSCKCPDVLPDPYTCRQLQLPDNQKGGNVFPDPMNPAEAVAATGCNVKCSEHRPTAAEPYKFADPENNNLACTSCHVAGSCEEVQDTYQNVSLAERTYCLCKYKPIAYPDPTWYNKYCDGFDESKYDASAFNCPRTNTLAEQSYLFPQHYCTDCCYYFCKKNSHDHHWCDNGKWPA